MKETFNDYESALLAASESGCYKMVEKLLKIGKSIFLEDAFNSACMIGDLELINLLIENGACGWDRALSNACQYGNIDIIQMMIEKGAQNFELALENSFYSDNFFVINEMIKKAQPGLFSFSFFFLFFYILLDIQILDECLVNACYSDSFEVAEFLINKGADLNYVNYELESPIHITLANSCELLAFLLIFNGVDIPREINLKNNISNLISQFSENKYFWSPNIHNYFPLAFRKLTSCFFISLKVFSRAHFIKIPKPIIFLIMKFLLFEIISDNKKKKFTSLVLN